MVVMGFVLNLMIKEAFWFGGCRRQRERERERESRTFMLRVQEIKSFGEEAENPRADMQGVLLRCF